MRLSKCCLTSPSKHSICLRDRGKLARVVESGSEKILSLQYSIENRATTKLITNIIYIYIYIN